MARLRDLSGNQPKHRQRSPLLDALVKYPTDLNRGRYAAKIEEPRHISAAGCPDHFVQLGAL